MENTIPATAGGETGSAIQGAAANGPRRHVCGDYCNCSYAYTVDDEAEDLLSMGHRAVRRRFVDSEWSTELTLKALRDGRNLVRKADLKELDSLGATLWQFLEFEGDPDQWATLPLRKSYD